mmetsp:Transcript_523/g.1328  ORF Transcript_523/g.1328 Transcript_523/m.1328 type:complete len:245 (+) Transcript_523:1021-1755(+)
MRNVLGLGTVCRLGSSMASRPVSVFVWWMAPRSRMIFPGWASSRMPPRASSTISSAIATHLDKVLCSSTRPGRTLWCLSWARTSALARRRLRPPPHCTTAHGGGGSLRSSKRTLETSAEDARLAGLAPGTADTTASASRSISTSRRFACLICLRRTVGSNATPVASICASAGTNRISTSRSAAPSAPFPAAESRGTIAVRSAARHAAAVKAAAAADACDRLVCVRPRVHRAAARTCAASTPSAW